MSGMSLTVTADASAKAVALDVRFVRPAVPETTAETAHRRNRRVASWGIRGRAANAGARVGAAQSDRTAANGSATSAHSRSGSEANRSDARRIRWSARRGHASGRTEGTRQLRKSSSAASQLLKRPLSTVYETGHLPVSNFHRLRRRRRSSDTHSPMHFALASIWILI